MSLFLWLMTVQRKTYGEARAHIKWAKENGHI